VKEFTVHEELLMVVVSVAVVGGRRYDGTVLAASDGGRYGELRPAPRR